MSARKLFSTSCLSTLKPPYMPKCFLKCGGLWSSDHVLKLLSFFNLNQASSLTRVILIDCFEREIPQQLTETALQYNLCLVSTWYKETILENIYSANASEKLHFNISTFSYIVTFQNTKLNLAIGKKNQFQSFQFRFLSLGKKMPMQNRLFSICISKMVIWVGKKIPL